MNPIRLALRNYEEGRAKILFPTHTVATPPERREISGIVYHKQKDGMWYPGNGRETKTQQYSVPKDLVEHAVTAVAQAWDPRFESLDQIKEAFEFNTRRFTHPLRDQILQCKNKEDMVTALLTHDIQVRTFDGEKYVGILKPEPEPEMEP